VDTIWHYPWRLWGRNSRGSSDCLFCMVLSTDVSDEIICHKKVGRSTTACGHNQFNSLHGVASFLSLRWTREGGQDKVGTLLWCTTGLANILQFRTAEQTEHAVSVVVRSNSAELSRGNRKQMGFFRRDILPVLKLVANVIESCRMVCLAGGIQCVATLGIVMVAARIFCKPGGFNRPSCLRAAGCKMTHEKAWSRRALLPSDRWLIGTVIIQSGNNLLPQTPCTKKPLQGIKNIWTRESYHTSIQNNSRRVISIPGNLYHSRRSWPKRALMGAKKALGRELRQPLQSMNTLEGYIDIGNIYWRQSLFGQMPLKDINKAFGHKPPYTHQVHDSWQCHLFDQGKNRLKARASLERSTVGWGGKHHWTRASWHNCILWQPGHFVISYQGKYAEAEPLYNEGTWKGSYNALGHDHMKWNLISMNN